MAFLRLSCFFLFTGCVLCVTITPRGESGHLLGTRKCTYGPAYWCDNISNSRECGSTHHCIENYWPKVTLTPDTDDVCTICRDMVKQARDQLLSNETQTELKEVFEGSCKLMPRLVAGECIKLVDDFIPELDEMLASQMNPQVVCKVAGLCNSARIDKILATINQKTARSVDRVDEDGSASPCSVCRERFSELQKFVASADHARIMRSLAPVCQELGSFSEICSTELYYGIDDLVEAVAELNGDDVCSLADFCPGFSSTGVSVDLVTGPGIDCDLCIHFVKRWRNILTSNSTEHEFKEVLEGICHHSHTYQTECLKMVERYSGLVYHYLVVAMDAHKLCKAAGICSIAPQDGPVVMTILRGGNPYAALLDSVDSADDQQENTLHHVTLTRSQADLPLHSFGHDTVNHVNPLDGSSVDQKEVDPEFMQLPLSRLNLPDVSAVFSANAEVCDICEFALHELQKVLMDDATEDEITEKVMRVCDLLPSSIEKSCIQFVNEYGVFVIEMLAQQINADQVCSLMRLCPLPSQQTNAVSVSVREPPTCSLCEFAMRELLDYLKKNKSSENIRDDLDKLCSILPHSLSHKCQELVNTFYHQIIDLIEADADPEQICEEIHLCHMGSDNDLVGNTILGLSRSVPNENAGSH